MGARGPKSTAEQVTVPTLIETRRPEPPDELNAAEAAIWRDTTGTMPFGWIGRAQFSILAAYCRHTHRANKLAQQVDAFSMEWLAEEGGLQRLDKLLAMAERETRALTACARSMRLTHQAQILPRGAGRRIAGATSHPAPWEFDDFDGKGDRDDARQE